MRVQPSEDRDAPRERRLRAQRERVEPPLNCVASGYAGCSQQRRPARYFARLERQAIEKLVVRSERLLADEKFAAACKRSEPRSGVDGVADEIKVADFQVTRRDHDSADVHS